MDENTMPEAAKPSSSSAQEGRVRYVMRIIRDVAEAVDRGTPADQCLADIYKGHKEFGSKDRRFYADTVFSYFRWWGWTQKLADATPERVTCLACLLDAVERSPTLEALCDEAGFAVTEEGLMGSLPLQQKAAQVSTVLADEETPDIMHLIPDSVVPALSHNEANHANDHLARLIAAFQQRPPTWLRLPKAGREKLLRYLQSRDDTALTHETIPYAVGTTLRFHQPSLEKELGIRFEIQDIASQQVGLLCDPKPGQSWWDVCAGSGGKALHLASLMENNCSIFATDKRPRAIQELKRRVLSRHLRCIEWRQMDVTRSEPLNRSFDGVLVDAPCTGIGTWSRNPDARWRFNPRDIRRQADLQLNILRNASWSVKAGGTLVYSVCTLTTAETVNVVRLFLEENSDFHLVPTDHPLTAEETDGRMWIWPWDGPCDGMFIARMVRDHSPSHSEGPASTS